MDTNIIIAGLYSSKGASYKLIAAACNNKIEFSISPLLLLEYIGKIEAKKADGLLELPLEDYYKIIQVLILNGQQISDPIVIRPTLADNADDKVLECAISGQCDAIITFNKKDFPEIILKQYDIIALNPGEFIQRGGLDENSI